MIINIFPQGAMLSTDIRKAAFDENNGGGSGIGSDGIRNH